LELGLYTDSVRDWPRDAALDLAAEVGATAVEIATGGQSSAPHLELDVLLGDPDELDAYRAAVESRGLRISALNCSAWPMHPVVGEQHAELIRRTFELAGRLGVRKIVTMSGCPGDGPGDTTINWVWSTWPADWHALLVRQWEIAIPFWKEMAAVAVDAGVERIAFELHPLQLAYNVPTLLRMREEVGPIIGANLDPSHLFWQLMDPIAVIQALGPAIHHVHLKDTQLQPERLAIAGVLDAGGPGGHRERSWNFRTVGVGHDSSFWVPFIGALRAVGYGDVLSIENEDPFQTAEEGVRDAAAFIRPLMAPDATGSVAPTRYRP
jgi:sugar phosphate isomerase/epimerase